MTESEFGSRATKGTTHMGSSQRQWWYGSMYLVPSTLKGDGEGDRVHVMSRDGARQGSLERERLFGEARPKDCVETRPSLWYQGRH